MDIRNKMPFIKFKPEWMVRLDPPYAGAIVRFVVKLPNLVEISVYCDWYDNLGFVGQPYWEIYPLGSRGADPRRFLLHETDEMIQAIEEIGDIYAK